MTEEKKDLEALEEVPAQNQVEESAADPPEEATEVAEPEATTPETPAETEAPAPAGEAGSGVDYSQTFRSLSKGDRVDGVVVHIDKEGVLVDVGTKSEGLIRPGEWTTGHVESLEDMVSVGEKVDVYVMESEDREGNLILSKKRADFEKAWDRVQQAFEEGKTLMAMVTDRVKGGLQVDLGIRGFVPGSHVGSGKVKSLDRYVGQSLPLKVLEVDRERRKVVLSHRLATEEQRSKDRDETMASLAEGQVRDGIVRRITNYGAFVDLGGIDGLLHISEMSWSRITHPSEVVKVGQKMQVMVLRLDEKAERVSLGLRQILPDPWAEIEGKYRVGDVISGTISRMVPFGAFVQLGGIEAIIPNTELSHKRVKRPEDVVSVGDTVEVKVIDVRADERRMTLSLRQMQEQKEHREYETRQTQSRSSGFDGRMTLGDLIGDKLQGFGTPVEDVEPEAVADEAPVVESAEDSPVPEPVETKTKRKPRSKANAAKTEAEPAEPEAKAVAEPAAEAPEVEEPAAEVAPEETPDEKESE